MSLQMLTKDCFHHLMTFLPCPMDKRNLVEVANTVQVKRAFQEPSLWRQWEEFNIVHPLFLKHPNVARMVLNNVSQIRKVILKFADNTMFPYDDIICSIKKSDKKVWHAMELEIDIPTISYTEPVLIHLLSIIFRKLGNSLVTVKFHVNERNMGTDNTAIDTFFRSVINTDKFACVTSLDLNTFHNAVGTRLEQVVNRMSLKYLQITGLREFVPTAFNNILPNLEELKIVDCNGILPEVFFAHFGHTSFFPNMKKVGFTCQNMHEAARWNGVARDCFQHCDFDVVITDPLDMEGYNAIDPDLQAEGYNVFDPDLEAIKAVLTNFIETQIRMYKSPASKHQITFGQRYKENGLQCQHIRALQLWVNDYEFKTEKSENCLAIEVKQNCKIFLLCSPTSFASQS